jgi:DNA-binding XRE family transcriptional regulator
MTQVQVIEKDGKPAFYVVPAAPWKRVRHVIEDAEDADAYSEALTRDDAARYPHAVTTALLDGAHPVRAWREHRGITQEKLAAASRASKPSASQIEDGKCAGSTATFRKLARALEVPIGALLPMTER